MFSETKSTRAMFSGRAAAGVRGPRMSTPWRATLPRWAVARALAVDVVNDVALAAAFAAFPADEALTVEER